MGDNKKFAETGELTIVCSGCKTRYRISEKHCPNCGLRKPITKRKENE